MPVRLAIIDLVFVDDLQRALARLGLVRRVGAVELAAGRDRPDGRRNVMLVGAGADEAQRPAVGRARALMSLPICISFIAAGMPASERTRSDAGISSKELIDAGDADRCKHLGDVRFGVRNEGHQEASARKSSVYSAAERSAAPCAPADFRRKSQPRPKAS